jgi:hypothetical protein
MCSSGSALALSLPSFVLLCPGVDVKIRGPLGPLCPSLFPTNVHHDVDRGSVLRADSENI